MVVPDTSSRTEVTAATEEYTSRMKRQYLMKASHHMVGLDLRTSKRLDNKAYQMKGNRRGLSKH